MKLFYSIGVGCYVFAIKIASIWSSKAKKWVEGRKNVWDKLETFKPQGNVVWFHCASLGEFEQGRPIMEKLKKDTSCQIVLSFFSPSGYEIKKNYKTADLVVYLPVDSKKNAQRFLKAIQPKQIYFVKYEFWANYITEAFKLKIPIYSVAALFREKQIFFKFYGAYMRGVLEKFTTIFVQNSNSQKLLETIELKSIVCGDPRYDRVLENAEKVEEYIEIENFLQGKKTFICGSIWQHDLSVLKEKINTLKDWKIIIAPHEIKSSFIHEIIDQIDLPSVQYSVLNEARLDANVLIIDNVGMLMNVYQYGHIAYVGGGLKTGLHNILEPAAFGLPVIFGNKTYKFPEASHFVDAEIGFQIEDKEDFDRFFDELSQLDISNKVKAFMQSRKGATKIVLNEVNSSFFID